MLPRGNRDTDVRRAGERIDDRDDRDDRCCQGVPSNCPTQALIGEFECGCTFIHQVSSLVKGHKRVRAVGLGHSYNDFTCSDDLMINMTALNQVLSLNPFSILDLKAYVDLYAWPINLLHDNLG